MSNSGFAHQDWTPVTLTKTKTKDEKIQDGSLVVEKKTVQNVNKQVSTKANLRKIENEEIALPIIPQELKILMQQARVAKKMTQKQLASACNFPEATIKSYEDGSAIPDNGTIAKIESKLGVHLPRPKKIKI
jgi:putative transcription factor